MNGKKHSLLENLFALAYVESSSSLINYPPVQIFISYFNKRHSPPSASRMRAYPTKQGRVWNSAFSLVEVVIAVGVAGFALITLLGLLPAGLSTFKKSMTTSVGTEIAQRVFNDAQIANFSDLTNTNRFFDEQGTELTKSNAVNCIYWVNLAIATNAGGSNSTSFLGSTSTNLATITVIVAQNPGGAKSASNAFSSTNQNALTFTTLIGHNQ